jgi:mono/diheme cytochrome c family protein
MQLRYHRLRLRGSKHHAGDSIISSTIRRTLAALIGAALAAGALASGADPLPTEALDYALQCQGCHGADGRGSGDIPSLHGIGGLARTPAGREYLARVPGVTNASISDARLAALLNFVITRWSHDVVPEDFAPYAASEIQAWRQPLLDPAATRARLETP